MKTQTRIAIALGTNLGDRLKNLSAAVAALKEDVLQNSILSSIYETEPWGILDQPRFLNAVILGECEWNPQPILNYLKSLERTLGRTTTLKNGPRVIDLDLIVFGDEIIEAPGLKVPHPGLPERDFVLEPLAEIWPTWRHPLLHQTALELKESLGKPALKIFSKADALPLPDKEIR